MVQHVGTEPRKLTSGLAMAVVSVPVVPVLLWLATGVCLGAVRHDPFYRQLPLSPSDAVLRGDYGQAMALIEAGASPRIAYPAIRQSDGQPEVLTPLEASVIRGDADLVRTLLDVGDISRDAALRRRAACLASSRDEPEIAQLLAGRPVAPGDCAAGAPVDDHD